MHLSAESVLLLAPNGTVLFAKNPSEDHAPASLVKLMTLYLACEDLETGRAQWDGAVRISRRAAETPRYAHGLPDPAGRSTAQDMARLIGHLVQDYPASRPLLGGASFIYRGRVHSRRIPLFQDPGGVQALKTGFTREAGYNLAIAAWREGQRFLLIVMGAQTRSLSFRDAKQLLRYGFVESGFEIAEEPRRPMPTPARRPNERRRHAVVPTRPAAVSTR